MSCEPVITIWGKELTISQCMTIRVAIEAFISDLTKNGLGDDEIGIRMTETYLENCDEIRRIIFGDEKLYKKIRQFECVFCNSRFSYNDDKLHLICPACKGPLGAII